VLDRDEFDRWQAAADDARAAADALIDRGRHAWASFLAEQSAGLALRGLLRGVGAAPCGRDLVSLGEGVVKALSDPLEPQVADALQRLARHGLLVTHAEAMPGAPACEWYGADQSTQALADDDVIRAFVQSAWDTLLDESSGEGED
jgi:HEPN domain-containing protein